MTTERFEVDGTPVLGHEGVFSRAFDMPFEDAETVTYDHTYVLVVTALTLPPAYRTNKFGDLIRRDRFQVTAARVAKGTVGTELAEMFELDLFDQGQLPFGAPADPPIITGNHRLAAAESLSEASQRAVVPSNGAMPTPGPEGPVTVPAGVTVGRVSTTGDETLRRFLEGAS